MTGSMGFGIRDSGFASRDSRFGIRHLGFVVLLVACAAAAEAQTADGAKVDADGCASCHDQPTGRTPSRDALKERTADAIHLALTSGSMAIQGVSLSVSEKK